MRHYSADLSRAHKDVRLYDMAVQQETSPQDRITLELETFYAQGGQMDVLKQKVDAIQTDYKLYSTIAGGFIGLVFGLLLINLSLKRSRKLYEIEHADCIACGKCFSYCPQNTIK